MDRVELLQAVADGRVTRLETDDQRGYWALYVLDAERSSQGPTKVERWALTSLKRAELIHMPMLGPPVITADGRAYLRRARDQPRS